MTQLLIYYIIGFVVAALIIRVTTPRTELDRGAALTACILWPGAVVVFVLAFVAFTLMDILFGRDPKRTK